MKIFLIFTFVTLVKCRPEAGYNYRQPFTPVGQQHSVGGTTSIIGGNIHQTGSISHPFGGTGSSSGGTGFSSSSGFGQIGGEIGHGTNINLITGISGGTSAGFNSENLGSFLSNGQSGFISQGPALVQKHIYVHVPPPEPEELTFQRQQVSLGVPQKHYKIIFIKAPSAPSLSQQQIALAAQTQEKTIVYVLVKKPDDISDISIPTITPTQPSKPEVYFIKYKAQKQNIAPTTSGAGAIENASFGAGSALGTTGISNIGIHGGGGTSFTSGTTSTGSTGINLGHGAGIISSSGSASSSIAGIPAPQYGPPGKSGPY